MTQTFTLIQKLKFKPYYHQEPQGFSLFAE
jgi:hypothetical protein